MTYSDLYGAVMFDENNLKAGPKFIRMRDDLDWLQKIIECDCIDIPKRYIGTTEYRIICDGSGLLKERKPTAFGGPTPIVGTIIFTNYTEGGESFRDLTENEEDKIVENLGMRDNGDIVAINVTLRPRYNVGVII